MVVDPPPGQLGPSGFDEPDIAELVPLVPTAPSGPFPAAPLVPPPGPTPPEPLPGDLGPPLVLLPAGSKPEPFMPPQARQKRAAPASARVPTIPNKFYAIGMPPIKSPWWQFPSYSVVPGVTTEQASRCEK